MPCCDSASPKRIKPRRPNVSAQTRSAHMLDFVMVAFALAFFALSVGYTVACDRL
jgi:hypothetical protein